MEVKYLSKHISPDCLIFDVDGVLMEALESFPEMIRIVFEEEWGRAGKTCDAPGYTLAHNAALKRHGAFNDDYDIAWTLLNISFPRGDKISQALPSPDELGKIVAGCERDCVAWLRDNYEETFDYAYIVDLCARTYFGDETRPGTWRMERPLLHAHWSDLPLPAYVYTGRNTREWRLAQMALRWEDFPDERIVNKDSGITKPSPEGLARICERFGHERPLFFGDTASDRSSHRAFGRGWFVSIGDLMPDEPLHFSSAAEALRELTGWSDRG